MNLAEGGAAVMTIPLQKRRIAPLAWLAMLSVLAAAAYMDLLSQLGFSDEAVATLVVVGLAAFASGVAGFAFSAICGAMLFQFRHDTVGVVETMLICSIANHAMCVWLVRRDIKWLPLLPFVVGGLMGVPFGVWLLLHLDVRGFKLALGTLLVVYGFYVLCRPPIVPRKASRRSDVVSGFIGGAMGGCFATPGAAVSIWCGMKGWDKARQRAVFQPFILLMQFAALGAIGLTHAPGATGFAIPPLAWVYVPAGLLGTWWGMAMFRRMTDNQFAKAVTVLLIVSGFALVA